MIDETMQTQSTDLVVAAKSWVIDSANEKLSKYPPEYYQSMPDEARAEFDKYLTISKEYLGGYSGENYDHLRDGEK